MFKVRHKLGKNSGQNVTDKEDNKKFKNKGFSFLIQRLKAPLIQS